MWGEVGYWLNGIITLVEKRLWTLGFMLQSSTDPIGTTTKMRWSWTAALICVSGSEMTANNSGPIFMTHHQHRPIVIVVNMSLSLHVTLLWIGTTNQTGVGTFHRSFRLEHAVSRRIKRWLMFLLMNGNLNLYDWLIVNWNFNIDALFFFSISETNSCYYNGTHFMEGSIVPTKEPCLMCKCQSKTLICALKVCPGK